MPSFNTTTKVYTDNGRSTPTAAIPTQSTSKPEPKGAKSVTFFSDGSSKRTIAGGGAKSVDARKRELAEVSASASGPSSAPVRLRSTTGAGLSSAQAEVNPKRCMIAIRGRETSLQAALTCGWVIRGADGNYWDARIGGDQTPGKPEEALEVSTDTPDEIKKASTEEDTSEPLPEGFTPDEAQKETLTRLHDLADTNSRSVDYAFTHAANSGDMEAEGFLKTLTVQTGMERPEVEKLVSDAQAVFMSAADAAVAEVSNVEPQLVYDWVRETNPSMTTRTIMEAQAGRFGAVREATNAYIDQLDTIDPEAALGADLGPHAKPLMINGKVAVRINGKLHSWAEAMRYRTTR